MNCTPNHGHLKKSMIRFFLCMFISKPRYNEYNDISAVQNMSKMIFHDQQRKQLEKNENVVKISERSIRYCSDLKVCIVK